MNTRAIYTTRLNVLDFFRIGLASWWNNSDVFYDEHKTSRAMRFLTGKVHRFHPAHLDFNKKNAEGMGLLYDFQDNINNLLADILEPGRTLPDWLKTSLFWEVRLSLEYSIVFIESARQRARELGHAHVQYYSLSSPFFEQTHRFYAKKGISLKALPGIPSSWKILASILFRFCMKKSVARPRGERPAIWMEYAITFAFKLTFWRKFLKNETYDIVYYLDRADTPAIPNITQAIEKENVTWMDLHAAQLLSLSGLGIVQLAKLFWQSWSIPDLSGSLKIMVFKHQVWHAAYVLVFGNYRVKMLIQHQDRSWTQVVQAHAIEQVGGILLGYHWSNLPYCMPNWFITAQHVYFVWGKTNYEAILRKGNSCRHILPSGMWIEES